MANEALRTDLFGPSPGEVREARAGAIRSSGMDWANMPAGRGAVAAAGMAGEALGRGVGGALGVYEDPAMAKSQLLQEAQQEVDSSGVDLMSDPNAYYQKAYEAMSKRGLQNEAMQVYQIMRAEGAQNAELDIKRNKLGLDERKTAAAETTADAKMLAARAADAKNKEGVKSSAAKLYQDYLKGNFGDPESEEAKNLFAEAWDKLTYRRPPDTTDIDLGPGEDKFLDELGKKRATSIEAQYSAVQSTDEIIFNSERIAALLDEENLIMGPGADFRFAAAKALNILGADNDETISNTQGLVSGLANNTLAAIKTSGLGTGQGFTAKDLSFLNDAKSGSINFTKEALADLTRINTTVARNIIRKWNSEMQAMPEDQRAKIARLGFNVEPIPEPEVRSIKIKKEATGKTETKSDVPSDFTDGKEVWDALSPRGKELWMKRQKN